MITKEFLEAVVACPLCKNCLKLERSTCDNEGFVKQGVLTCASCNASYQIANGVPNLLSESKLDGPNWGQWRITDEQFRTDFLPSHNLAQAKIFKVLLDDFFSRVDVRGSVLDIGGADGVIRHWLPKEYLYASVDPNAALAYHPFPFFDQLFPRYREPYLFLQGAAEYLPVKSSSFDNTLFISSLDHCNNVHIALDEAKRVLKSNGQLLIYGHVTPITKGVVGKRIKLVFAAQNRNEAIRTLGRWVRKSVKGIVKQLAREIFGVQLGTQSMDHHLHHFSGDNLVRLCREHGFQRIEFHWLERSWYHGFLVARKGS